MIRANAGGWLMLIVFLAIGVVVFFRALRRGRRKPPLSRGDYLRSISGIYAVTPIFGALLWLLNPWFFATYLVLVLFIIEYFQVRFSVQRLSDIDGTPYRGVFRAFLSLHILMVIYLCLRKGGRLPHTDIDVF